eukprot:GHVU01005904.1.p1 GENE.GHVU01005904.1~~GHVU01005904.1.p1  ORF type:complete len:128 (+),score=3.93 GHVU01005904.1:235-618(+)
MQHRTLTLRVINESVGPHTDVHTHTHTHTHVTHTHTHTHTRHTHTYTHTYTHTHVHTTVGSQRTCATKVVGCAHDGSLCSFIGSFIHSATESLTHSLTHAAQSLTTNQLTVYPHRHHHQPVCVSPCV